MKLEYNLIDNKLILDYRKAIYWTDQSALLLSDLHLGKSNHFRKSGIPVPETKDNYARLKSLIADYGPKKIYFLGDLFHSKKNKALEEFDIFFKNYKIEKHLILGNHDIINRENYTDLNLICHESILVNNVLLLHDPDDADSNYFSLCGHIHPKVKLNGKGKQYLSLPCFFFGINLGIIPAFGDFTGGYHLNPKKEDDVFVIAEKEVIKVS